MEEKTKKEKRQEALAEGVLEIVFYLLFLGVGFLVCWVWSLVFSANIATMDPDTLVLIGLIALAVIVAAICWLKKLIKSREKRAVATCHNMKLHAGPFEKIKTGEKTIEEVGEEAFAMLIDVLSGKMTKNEALGYFGSMDIWCMGPVI